MTRNASPALERHGLFEMPIWRSSVPEFEPHADQLRSWILHEWERGSFRRHQWGYGYQTPPTLFNPGLVERQPALAVLRQAFENRVLEVLRQRTNHSVHLPPRITASMAWVLVQTSEEWVNNAWHDHAPALLSGCYYLQLPECEGELEGALAFMRPGLANPFIRQIQCVRPRQGEFILFPSALTHRPQPTPSARGLRISINMDAYVRWEHWDEDAALADAQAYHERLENSFDPDLEPPPETG